jgi:hypothetical protein
LGVPNPHQDGTNEAIEPGRVLTIWLRLGQRYYDLPPASYRIATSVWAELNDFEERSAAIS